MSELLAKVRAMRDVLTTRTNTKAPIRRRDELVMIGRHIDTHAPEWLSVFYRISLATGWRTSDVLAMRFDAIDQETGKASIVVGKQTKSAEARAVSKALAVARDSRKQAAMLAGDAVAYMRWDAAPRAELEASLTAEELAAVAAAISRAPVKRDTKQLPRALVNDLQELQRRTGADHIFDRSVADSNNKSGRTETISRQSAWSAMARVFDQLTGKLEAARKLLSTYSLRKSWAFQLYEQAGRSVSAVCELFGHSSLAMTRKYLMLERESDQLQAAFAASWD